MMPVPIEQLPADTRDLITAYLKAHPQSRAAHLRPRFGTDEDQWFVLYGPDRRCGVLGFGPTVLTALASWEENFKEAVTAEQ